MSRKKPWALEFVRKGETYYVISGNRGREEMEFEADLGYPTNITHVVVRRHNYYTVIGWIS
jgi:hypothetical protein